MKNHSSFFARSLGTLCMASCAAVAQAQTNPDLSLAGASYFLRIPILEYGMGADRQFFTAKLSSTDLSIFSLDAGSVATLSGLSASGIPVLTQSGSDYNLDIPFLEVAGLGQAYAATLTSNDLQQWHVVPSSIATVADTGTLPGPSGVHAWNVDTRSAGVYSFGSSSKLQLGWTAPQGMVVDHYEILATEPVNGSRVSANAASSSTSLTLTGLKAATPYGIMIKACQDAACLKYGASPVVTGTTANEYWQLQGSGHSVSGLSKIVSDGNARLSVTRIGNDAGSANAGKLQLYYGPMPSSGAKSALAVAVGTAAANASDSGSYLGFASLAGNSGLISPDTPDSGSLPSSPFRPVSGIYTGQGVPLSAAMGGNIRLFFEALGSDNKTRILSIDSKDGHLGLDFNGNSPTTCSSDADYAAGGGCTPTLAIGVEGDATGANAKIVNARQNKIGYPTQTDWRWDGAPGTFMVFTTDKITGCSTAQMNHGYAVWDGSTWNVQYAANGCPKLFANAQACLPMHLGGTRYKMYCGDPSMTAGKLSGSRLPFVGPKNLIYADGNHSGADAYIDFEDWEALTQARDTIFLWPDNSKLDDKAEGYIDDYHFIAPTGDLELQVAYVTITDGSVVPFAAAAVLLNP